MSGYQKNPWVQFLRRYGPIPNNDNMYDEQIQRSARRSNSKPLRFRVGALFEELLDNLRSASPRSVLLTGTAGDGKTYLCREVWSALGGDEARWSADEKVLELALPSGRTLRVIRDLTELSGAEADALGPLIDALVGKPSSAVSLIAANDGQLLQALDAAVRGGPNYKAYSAVEELLVRVELRAEHEAVLLYNLSRQSSAELLRSVLGAVTSHEGWSGCDGCAGQSAEPALRCPVWENLQRLREPRLQERLVSLLELGDHSGYHLPVRQLLLLTSNALLGHPSAPDKLLRCNDVPKVVREGAHRASLYANVLGENLSPLQRERTLAFDVLGRFGLGEETSNKIDSLLVYGAFDPELAPQFEALVQRDPVYGAHAEFSQLQTTYLEGASPEHQRAFCDALRAQRQRLFFTAPGVVAGAATQAPHALPVWDLTVFRHGGDFLHRVLAPLRRGGRVERSVLSTMVRGLNRVFTGLMTSDDQFLYLASSGSHSQARISRVLEHRVAVDSRNRQEGVAIELHNGAPALSVTLERGRSVPLPLTLVRFEFLARVSEGALPTNFSRECYEDLLSFKSKLLRRWRELCGATQEHDFSLELLRSGTDGRMETHRLSMLLGGAS